MRAAARSTRSILRLLVPVSVLSLLVTGATLLPAEPAGANTQVTLYVSPSGSSSSGCTTPGVAACGTIQDAINELANYTATDVTIDVAAGTYDEHDVIDFYGSDTLVIQGAGAGSTAVDATGSGTDFTVDTGPTLIEGLTITDGAGGSNPTGGAVYNNATDLTLESDTISNSTAQQGGAIGNFGTVTLVDDTLTNDGEYNSDANGNYGGAVWTEAGVVIATDDTFSNDTAGSGGGIYTIYGKAILDNDTFANDYGAACGGAVMSFDSTTTMENDTLSQDTTIGFPGGGLCNIQGGTATISNSIIDGAGCGGTITDGGYNVESDDSCELGSTDLVDSSSIDLAPLASNGSNGPETQAITTASSAFDAVPIASCALTSDERGQPRPGSAGGNCDAGAYELAPGVPPPGVTISSPADHQVFAVGEGVTTTFSCSDPSGPGLTSCLDDNGQSSPEQLATSSPGVYTYTATAVSMDGEASTATIDYTVAAPPVVTITSPAAGGTYAIGQTVSTTFSCAEGTDGTGLTSCTDGAGSSSPGTLVTSTPGTFTYTVTVVSSDGQSTTASITYSVSAAAPDAPVIGVATLSGTTASVAFSAPSTNGGSPISSYTATCVSSDGGTTRSGSGTASPVSVASLDRGHTYTCSVTATNGAGTGAASAPSNVLAVPSVPGAPTIGTVTLTGATASVPFVAPLSHGSPITSYAAMCVSSDGGATRTGGAASSPVSVPSLGLGHSYTCTVTATNGIGTGAASAASNTVVVPRLPGAPTGVGAVTGSTTTPTGVLTVTYTAPADNGGSAIVSYRATCASTNGGATKVGTHLGAVAAPIPVPSVTTGKSYQCTVTATNGVGTGPSSAGSVGVVVGAPSPALSVTVKSEATSVATGSLTVSYAMPASANGSAVTSFRATCTSSNGGATNSGVHNGATPAPITVAALTTGRRYTCSVAASNARGAGPSSTSSLPVVVGAPAAPTNVTAANVGPGDVMVSFTPGSNHGSAILSYTATCISIDGGATASQSGSASPLTVVGLTVGNTYTCFVTAQNGRGIGPPSQPSEVVLA